MMIQLCDEDCVSVFVTHTLGITITELQSLVFALDVIIGRIACIAQTWPVPTHSLLGRQIVYQLRLG